LGYLFDGGGVETAAIIFKGIIMAKRNGKKLLGGYIEPELKEWVDSVAGKNFTATQVLVQILESAKARGFRMDVQVSEVAK
jgi:hypothetical protein